MRITSRGNLPSKQTSGGLVRLTNSLEHIRHANDMSIELCLLQRMVHDFRVMFIIQMNKNRNQIVFDDFRI
jgi:hypothetical protein